MAQSIQTPTLSRKPLSASFRSLTGICSRVKVVDIGANPIDAPPPYAGMMLAGEVDLIGFEPNPEALAELHRRKGSHETYLPYAVGDGQRHTLYVGQAPGMTSLFRPDPAVLNLFHGFPQWGRVRCTRMVDSVRLDDVEETIGAEFLKIDIEGGELMAFSHAQNRLREILVIQTEVEFLPLYSGQPLFSEVELFLRKRGFMLHKFDAINTRVVRPMLVNNDIRAGLSQVMAADAVFIRDLTTLEMLADSQLLVMARILHDCYQSLDLVYHLLVEYDRRTSQNTAESYMLGLQSSLSPNACVS
jgi:FkbM family methyltransferase